MQYGLIILGIIFQATFIKAEHQQRYGLAVLLKGSASLCFVLLGLFCGMFCRDESFAKAIQLGLLFGMGGDILLNMRYLFKNGGNKIFLIGILVFLTGHVMYLIALWPFATHRISTIILGCVLSLITLLWIFSKITAKLAFKIFGVFYIGTIVMMTSFALVNYLTLPTPVGVIFLIGALLFLASDIELILNTFGPESKFSLRVTNLSLYYLGQICIATSLLFF